MEINIKLDRDFERFVNSMKEKYGEHMLELNGLSEKQLNHTEFIDYFVDKNKNTADTSIDGNANVGHKDVTTLENEMMKPHLKLLAYNKIFLELKQKYGLRQAKKWAEEEWNGAFYLHDFYSTSLKSYCIFPQECCTFILEGKKLYASLEDIYKLLPEEEHFDAQQNVYYKEPKNLAVLDYDTKLNQKRYTKVYLVSHKETDKDLYFNKLYNGANLITTEDHSYITTTGEVAAKNLLEDETICYSMYDSDIFTNSMSSYAGLELTQDLGYLVGMYLAEGFDSRGQMFICQDYEHSKAYFEKIKATLEKLDIPYKYNEARKAFSLTNGNFNWEKKLKKIILGHHAYQKHLCPDFIHFNFDFLKGILAGIIDGDGNISQNKVCMIRMTSRTLINQIRAIGLANNVYFSSRLPYIQSKAQKAKIISKYPVYSANVNMNRNAEFFLSLPSIKVKTQFTDFNFNEEFANKNYLQAFGELKVRDNTKTYKPSATVYDLSTQSHTFICNDILVHNCFAYDLKPIVEKGLFFVNNFNNQPPKHLVTFTDFVGEAVSWLSNRTSGAVGLPNYLIYSYYFWKKDVENHYFLESPEYYRDQEFQRIIYKLNQPYLRVTQSAFTNFSIFDRSYIEALFGGLIFPDGSMMIDYVDDFIEYEKAFMNKVSEIREQNVMTFPVLTYALLRVDGKFVDEDFAKWCCRHNMKWADSNFFISKDVTSLSNCCRLVSNVKNLGFFNSIGGSALEVGSVKVNTINLARIAYETKDKKKYLEKLKDRVVTCVKTLDVVREIIKKNIDRGLLPNYSLDLIHLKSQYNTIGINALWEAVTFLGGTTIDEFGKAKYTEEGQKFAEAILNTIIETKDKFIEENNLDYQINCEQVPAERCATILQEKDKELYEDGCYDLPLYGNQWIPLGVHTSLINKLSCSAKLDEACSGGSIAHINCDSPFTNFDMAWDLLNKVADLEVPYFAFCTRISACENNHGFYGDVCPTCGKPKVTTYQRIVGFLTPEINYSKERKAEFKMRDWFTLGQMEDL